MAFGISEWSNCSSVLLVRDKIITPLKAIHNISHPGQPPSAGDTVELEAVGGFIRRVDPVTRQVTETRQQFVYAADDTLKPK